MPVYVDNARLPFARMIMCHCWGDTEEELFAMMDAIGVDRKWVQRPPKASWLHFDISLGKKALALARGAILTDRFGPVEHIAKLAGDTKTLEMIRQCRLLRQPIPKGGTLPMFNK